MVAGGLNWREKHGFDFQKTSKQKLREKKIGKGHYSMEKLDYI